MKEKTNKFNQISNQQEEEEEEENSSGVAKNSGKDRIHNFDLCDGRTGVRRRRSEAKLDGVGKIS